MHHSADLGHNVAMASWAGMRANGSAVRVALYKGKDIPSEDYETVQKVLGQVRWNRLLALCFAALFCFWLGFFLFVPAISRWTAVLSMFWTGVMTWSLLRNRKRILDGATKLGFRRVG